MASSHVFLLTPFPSSLHFTSTLEGQHLQRLTQICTSIRAFTSPWSLYLDVTEIGATKQLSVCPLNNNSSDHNKSHVTNVSGAVRRHADTPGSGCLSRCLCFHLMKTQSGTKHMSPRWHLYPKCLPVLCGDAECGAPVSPVEQAMQPLNVQRRSAQVNGVCLPNAEACYTTAQNK